MDPVTLAIFVAALATGLVTALSKLVEKGLTDKLIEKGFEPLRELITRKYDKAKDEEALRKAVEAAARKARGDTAVGTRLGKALNSIKDKPARAALTAAAAIEMTSDDPARLPPELLKELDLPDDQRATFSHFLFEFRRELLNIAGYSEGIRYADEADKRGKLEGLYELVAGLHAAVVDTKHGPALQVVAAPPSEEPYLSNALNEFVGLPLEGRSTDDTVRPDKPLRLEKVYIALNTTETRAILFSPEEIRLRNARHGLAYSDDLKEPPVPVFAAEGWKTMKLSALRALMEHRRLVLLGDPGSGKSIFAQHLALCLAGARLHPQSEWPAYFRAADVERWGWNFYPFPILVRLREFAHDTESLPDDPRQRGRAEHLLACLEKVVAALGRKALVEAEVVRGLLEEGRALVLLDGLDEVTRPIDSKAADADRRAQVAQAIHHFAQRYPHAHLLVTCRIKQYELDARGEPAAPWGLPGFPTLTLADFDEVQIRDFVTHWYAELEARGRKKAAGGDREGLLTALVERRDLADLAPKPILLTQMALVHAQEKLPESRVKLYERCAELLLWEWERLRQIQSGRQGETAADILREHCLSARQADVQAALDQAVFEALRTRKEVPADGLRRALRQVFVEKHGLAPADAAGPAEKFIEHWLKARNGLLLPAGEDTFVGPHPSFLEFMAARYLYHNVVEGDEWDAAGPRLIRAPDGYDKWREVLRFAAGLAPLPRVASAVNELCPDALPNKAEDFRDLLLSGEIARDAGGRDLHTKGGKTGRQAFERLERHLLRLMRDTGEGEYPNDSLRLTPPDVLPPKTRLDAGLLLDALGWTPPDLDDFVSITMGDKRYAIGKYPVTNFQYKRFLESEDYADEKIWKAVVGFDAEGKPENKGDEAWAWFQDANKEGKRAPLYWDDPRFGIAHRLLPVVGVTWYEAAAYCAWLTRRPPEDFSLPPGFVFRLPSDEEWLTAAGGVWKEKDTEEKTPRYPWQKVPAEVTREEVLMRANTTESDFSGTSPVCMYPAGASLAGTMDMSGNVWEWQANLYRAGTESRALRGGAWSCFMGLARVAVRSPRSPWLRLERQRFSGGGGGSCLSVVVFCFLFSAFCPPPARSAANF